MISFQMAEWVDCHLTVKYKPISNLCKPMNFCTHIWALWNWPIASFYISAIPSTFKNLSILSMTRYKTKDFQNSLISGKHIQQCQHCHTKGPQFQVYTSDLNISLFCRSDINLNSFTLHSTAKLNHAFSSLKKWRPASGKALQMQLSNQCLSTNQFLIMLITLSYFLFISDSLNIYPGINLCDTVISISSRQLTEFQIPSLSILEH